MRLLPSGALDASFAPQPGTLDISSLVVQADGKMVITGEFNSHFGQPVGKMLRLNEDGTLDFAFIFNSAGGVNGHQFSPTLALQPQDGKIVIDGSFSIAGGMPRRSIARFNTDGLLDASIVPGTAVNAIIGAVAVQPDGRILASSINNSTLVTSVTNKLVRLNATGAYDNSFVAPQIGVQAYLSGAIRTLLVQPDGRVVLAFGSGLVPSGGVVRLTTSGAFDTTWNVPVAPALTGKISSLQL